MIKTKKKIYEIFSLLDYKKYIFNQLESYNKLIHFYLISSLPQTNK